MFVDVSGFTALSERLAQRGKVGAEQLTDVLNSVFGTMLGLAAARGGSLLKFGGDALFLLFTGPGHAVQAACATVEMRTALAATATTPGPAGRLRLRMSVGVHSGGVDLFLVGASHRELVIVGPATTAVASMEAAASAGQILIGPQTAAALPAGAVGDPLGPGLSAALASRTLPTPGRPACADPGRDVDVSRFVPTALRAVLSAGDPESEHRTVGVSFVRFTGIDTLLEDQGHQATADALHTLVCAAQDCADTEGVTFLATDLAEDGGKVILVAGFPTTAEDDQGRLLRASRRIVTDSLAQKWPLAVRAGLNRGHVFAGAIGSFERATVTVMGDTVNLAARVMARADPGTVLATPATLDNAQTLFATEPVEPFMVKGKSRPVNAYQVDEETGTRPPRGLGSLPLLGRDDELAKILSAIDDLKKGTGSVITLVGETGIGKTRLMREALSARDTVPSVRARAEPYGAATPYRPLRDPLRHLLGLDHSGGGELSVWLSETVPLFVPDLAPWLPLIGDVLSIQVDETQSTRDLNPQYRPQRTADALVRLLEVLGGNALILAIDDAHYADEATAALLSRLEREAGSHPWLLLSTRRDEDGGYRPASARAIELGPLSYEAVRSLVMDGTAAAPLRPDDVDAVVSRVAGNPLYIEETLSNLREHGSIEALPSSLEAMVAAQIDALSPLARRVARRASVLGRSFRVTVLRDLFGDEEVGLDDATQKELADVLEPDGRGRLRFRHALLRDAAYDSLPFARRRAFHLLAAQSTVRRGKGRLEEYADNLALHFWMGGDYDATWRWARMAAEQARDAYANSDAAVQYQRALAASDRIADLPHGELAAVWESLGDVLLPMGRYTEAIKAYRGAARASLSDHATQARLLAKRARAQERAQRFPIAYRELTAASKIALQAGGDKGRRLQAEIVATRAYLLTFQDRFVEAHREAEQAIQLAEVSGSDEALALASVALETALASMGLPADGSHLQRALTIYERRNDLDRQSTTLSNLGAIAYFSGDWTTAEQRYEQAATIADRIGDVAGAAISRGNLAEILVNQGRVEEARPILTSASRTLRSTGLSADAGFTEVLLARCLTIDERHDEADEILESLRLELLAAGQPDVAYSAAIAQAENAVEAGRASAALDLLDEAGVRARDSGSVLTPLCQFVRARALRALARPAEAADAARAGLAEAEDQGLVLERSMLVGIRALVDVELMTQAGADLAAAEAALEGLGVAQQRIRHVLGN